jgi:hypothetical protein
MSLPIRHCGTLAILLCLSPLTYAHSYSHINGNDWVITCNDGTEINISGSETQVYNSVRSSCRGHEAAPADSVAEAATGEAGLASGNHNTARSSKSTVAPDLPLAPPPPRRLDQAPRAPAPAQGQ